MKRDNPLVSQSLQTGDSNRLLLLLPIFIILVIAFIVRLHGVNYGLPYMYDADEHIYVENCLRMIAQATIYPNYYATPSQTTIYINIINYLSIFAFGTLTGEYQSIQGFVQQYQHDPTIFFLSARIVILTFDVMSVFLVYLIGQHLFNRKVGLVAAALLAVVPIHVEVSRVIRPDIQMTFFVLLVFWFCLKIIDRQTYRNYILAGVALGLALMSKYPGAVALSLIMGTHFIVTYKDLFNIRNHSKLIISGVGCLLGMFIAAPTFFSNLHYAYASFRGQNDQDLPSAVGNGILENVVYYINLLITNDLAIVGFVLLLLGAFLLIRSRKLINLMLLTFPIVYLVAISAVSLHYNRYMLPSLPFFVIIVAYAFITITTFITQKLSQYPALIVNGIFFVALLFPLASTVITRGNELAGPDTRTVAGQWMLENLPPNSNILMEFYSPQLSFGAFNYYGGLWSGERSLLLLTPEEFKTDFVIARNITGRIPTEQILNGDIDYVVITEFYERYLAEADLYQDQIDNYETLMENGELVYEIRPISGQQSGPPISIYQLTNK